MSAILCGLAFERLLTLRILLLLLANVHNLCPPPPFSVTGVCNPALYNGVCFLPSSTVLKIICCRPSRMCG